MFERLPVATGQPTGDRLALKSVDCPGSIFMAVNGAAEILWTAGKSN